MVRGIIKYNPHDVRRVHEHSLQKVKQHRSEGEQFAVKTFDFVMSIPISHFRFFR